MKHLIRIFTFAAVAATLFTAAARAEDVKAGDLVITSGLGPRHAEAARRSPVAISPSRTRERVCRTG